MSPFNADAFLNQTVSGPMSTSVPACPEGEYKAMVDDGDKWLTFAEGVSAKTNEPWYRANILFNILDDGVRATMKREKILVPMQCFLDVDDKGGMDTSEGKNVSIGRLRAAAGQMEEPSWTLGRLKGAGPFVVKITQRSDPKDPSIKYAEVSRVAKIS